MKRRVFALLLLVGVLAPFLSGVASGARAPQKGFVFVRTLWEGGGAAAYQEIEIEKLQGSYPLPPGPHVTNGVGQIWIDLYPGTYRFTAAAEGAQPTSWTVPVASRGEYYIWFTIPAPEI